jgi:hypothetical protein
MKKSGRKWLRPLFFLRLIRYFIASSRRDFRRANEPLLPTALVFGLNLL